MNVSTTMCTTCGSSIIFLSFCSVRVDVHVRVWRRGNGMTLGRLLDGYRILVSSSFYTLSQGQNAPSCLSQFRWSLPEKVPGILSHSFLSLKVSKEESESCKHRIRTVQVHTTISHSYVSILYVQGRKSYDCQLTRPLLTVRHTLHGTTLHRRLSFLNVSHLRPPTSLRLPSSPMSFFNYDSSRRVLTYHFYNL